MTWALLPAAAAAEVHEFPAPSGKIGEQMVIYSSLDLPLAGPLIAGFQASAPDISIRYEELLTGEITARVLAESDAGQKTADFTFSSAMDQQVKLANDGYAREVFAEATPIWPRWGNWRNSAYALTFEPAVLAYYRPAFADQPPPATRFELLGWLRAAAQDAMVHETAAPGASGAAPEQAPQALIGTYDVERSAVGYLFLARDQEHFGQIWSLVGAMGRAGLAQFSTTQEVLEEISAGRLLLGYNLLGSYAADWARSHPEVGLILPKDYVVVVSRVGLVPRAAARPDLGERFLDYMMSQAGQTVLAEQLRLPAISLEVSHETSARAMQEALGEQLKPVPVSPGLLVYLDQAKRKGLIDKWHRALSPR